MIRYLYIFLLTVSTSLFAQNTTEKVLFIGNSMTSYNDMPQIFAGIAQSKGKSIQTTQHSPGGTGFVNHVGDNTLYAIIRSSIFDKVVMQPGTGESIGHSFPISATAQRGNRLKDSIKKYSPCAQFFLYEISNGVQGANEYPAYFTSQKKIKDSIYKLSGLMQVPMIPAGEAVRKYYENNQDLLLHSDYNNVHPNLNGSYMVAAAVYAAIYQDKVYPSTHLAGVSQINAENFQGIADNTILNNLSDWNLSSFNLFSNFTYNISGVTVSFQNQSVNSNTVSWDFGDGTTSIQNNPSHQYPSSGTYNVTLSAYRGNCKLTRTKTVVLSQLAVDNVNKKKLKIYPNPASEFFTIESDAAISGIEIYTVSGNLVTKKENINAKDYIENVSLYSAGGYLIKITFYKSEPIIYKLIKD